MIVCPGFLGKRSLTSSDFSSSTVWTRISSASGLTFDKSGTTGVGRPYIQNVTDSAIEVGVMGSINKYTFDLNGVLQSTTTQAIPITNSISVSGFAICYPCGTLGTKKLYAVPNSNPATRNSLMYDDGATLATGTRLDTYINQSLNINGVIVANDGQSAIILQGSSLNITVYYVIDINGNVLSNGTVGLINGSTPSVYTFGFGRLTTYHFGACCYDSIIGLVATAYGAGGGEVRTFKFIGNVLTPLSGSSLSYYTFPYPSVYTKDGVIYAFTYTDFDKFTNNIVI